MADDCYIHGWPNSPNLSKLGLAMPPVYCVKEKKPCVLWVEKYFKDCLCNYKDDWSFGFGICSLLCWAVGDIPQIVTNFQAKSSHGISFVFLLTWIAGDVFNLAGCLLEPATLPTQLYTALLCTISTIVLLLQSVYYDYLWQWCHSKDINDNLLIEEEKIPLNLKKVCDTSISITSSQSPVLARREFYDKSARLVADNDTPPFRSCIKTVKSCASALLENNDSFSDDQTTFASSNHPTKPRLVSEHSWQHQFAFCPKARLLRIYIWVLLEEDSFRNMENTVHMDNGLDG